MLSKSARWAARQSQRGASSMMSVASAVMHSRRTPTRKSPEPEVVDENNRPFVVGVSVVGGNEVAR
jgi:hypothetical protein